MQKKRGTAEREVRCGWVGGWGGLWVLAWVLGQGTKHFGWCVCVRERERERVCARALVGLCVCVFEI